MRVLALAGFAALVSLTANVARADEQPPMTASAPTYVPPPPVTYAPPPPGYYYPPPAYYYAYPPPKPKRTWYGWQTLATDGGAALLLYAAIGSRGDSEGLAYGSLALYNLGAPIVHFGHGNYGRGLASLAVRSLPSMMVFGEPQQGRGDYSLALLTVISVPTMIAVDAAALAREDEEEAPRPTVAPTASATKSGGMVGVAGTF